MLRVLAAWGLAAVFLPGSVGAAAAETPAEIVEARLLTDFSGDLPTDDGAVTVSLRFVGIRPLPGGGGDVVVQLERRDGRWAGTGHTAAADYNQRSSNRVALEGVEFVQQEVGGKLQVRIGPDSPRPGKVGFPNPPDEFAIEFTADRRPGKTLPYQPDTEAFMPPWRKDVPQFGGELVEGTYEAEWLWKGRSEKVRGKVVGSVSPAPVPGLFGGRRNVHFEPARGGGVKVLARLSPKRVAPPSYAQIVKPFEKPEDWRRWEGLRLAVGSRKRRDGLGVSVSLHEAGGTWYSVRNAALLLGKEAEFIVPFADFRGGTGGNYFLDLDALDQIAVGIENQHGVGDVEFTVRKVELVRWGRGFGGRPEGSVRVRVDPETVVSFNGADAVPKGLFGMHEGGRPNVRDREGKPGPVEYMRQVKPGYFRRIHHTGFGGKPISDEEIAARIRQRLEDQEEPDDLDSRRIEAADALDNMVLCHTQDLWARPGWMDIREAGRPAGPRGFADRVRVFYRHQGARAWVPGDRYNWLRRFEVWNEPFMWGRHINMGHQQTANLTAWTDPTQYGYIPAHLGADAYAVIFDAAYEGARSANPHVLLGGPSAPAFCSDDYGVFEHYVARILDRIGDRVDFLTEHHYGGLRQAYPASYEVAVAYLDTKHGRRVPVYNTECNDLGGDAPDKAHYNIEEVLSCIRDCPDKAVGRAMHMMSGGYFASEGEAHAYEIMGRLRGRILQIETSDPSVMAVAATPEDGTVVVFCFNNSRFDRRVELGLGGGFEAVEQRQLLCHEGDTGEEALGDTEGQAVKKADGTTELVDGPTLESDKIGIYSLVLPSRSAASLVFRRAGYRPTKLRCIEQSFCDAVLARVEPKKPVRSKVLWRGQGPAGAKQAVLRLVTTDVHRGEGVAVINGQTYPLPWSSSNDGAAVVQEIAIDPAVLGGKTAVEFRCADPATANGFVVWTASICLTR